MKSRKIRGLILFFAIFSQVGFVSCSSKMEAKKKEIILLEGKEIKFITEKAIKMNIDDKVTFKGQVNSKIVKGLKFKRDGVLTSYNIYIGKEVKKGDILATLDIEDVKHKLEIAKLQLEQAEVELQIVEESGDQLKIKNASIQLKIRKSEYDKLKYHNDNYSLISEIDGIITAIEEVDLGNKVSGGRTYINVIDKNSLFIKGNVDQEKRNLLAEGDTIQVIMDGESYDTTINEIEREKVWVNIPKEIEDKISVLAPIQVQKVLKEIKDAILVPKTSVFIDKDGDGTIQVLEEGRVITKKIKVGQSINEFYQILEGIKEGEEVLVK